MSYHISFGLLEDISRVTAVYQSFIMKIESYNHSIIYTPAIPLRNPTWNYQYIIAGSQKQIIKFYLLSLQLRNQQKILASGKLDLRECVAINKPGDSFKIRLTLDSSYNNEVILHLRCKRSEQSHSRNLGLKQIQRNQQNITNKTSLNKENNTIEKIENDKQILFEGACETRNFFSFLDPIFKGQSFNFIQPVKK